MQRIHPDTLPVKRVRGFQTQRAVWGLVPHGHPKARQTQDHLSSSLCWVSQWETLQKDSQGKQRKSTVLRCCEVQGSCGSLNPHRRVESGRVEGPRYLWRRSWKGTAGRGGLCYSRWHSALHRGAGANNEGIRGRGSLGGRGNRWWGAFSLGGSMAVKGAGVPTSSPEAFC